MSKTATDVIKGLRKGKIDRTAFLTTVYSEIREEVKSTDLSTKSNAIRKLFVLALEGYDMEWASFHILEVMSSAKFSEKHSGLLAASQCFRPNSDILFLATNFFRRELVASNPTDTCVALNTLACVVNPDMSKELMHECVSLLNASKPILRKKTCVLFFRLFSQYPEGLTSYFERLAEKLKDDNSGVVMGTVSTIFELSRLNPSFVLYTAQSLYELMNTTTNNWVLIKLIKSVIPTQFVELAKVEPRLLKKLSGPFKDILLRNPAKSVEFELIRGICTIFTDQAELIRLALTKLNGFLDSNDPNLKYLGLTALEQLISIAPQLAEEYKIFILEALQSKDITIRLRALKIVKLTATAETLQEIVNNLLLELEKASNAGIKEEIVSCVLFLLSVNQYELVVDFRWMFEVLLKMILIKTQSHEAQLSSIMLDVVLRVEELREEAMDLALDLLEKFDSLRTERCEALTALLFLLGEFCGHLKPQSLSQAVNLVLKPRWHSVIFHENVYNALSSCLFKLSLKAQDDVVANCIEKIKENCANGEHMEAQERSLIYLNVLRNCKQLKEVKFASFLPIHPSAQGFISPPDELLKEFEVDENEIRTLKEDGSVEFHYFRDEDFKEPEMTDVDRKLAKMKIKEKQMNDPFYIKTKKGKKKGKRSKAPAQEVKKSEVKESVEEVVEDKPVAVKKYTVNRTDPLIPQ